MTDEEIDKLAREYAKEAYNPIGLNSSTHYEWVAEDVIRFLLRSHFIVPKSVVQEEWEGLENQGEMCREMNAMAGVLAVGGQMSMLQRIFGSQLGKEETE